jgi:PAS domain S-box-containing protein
MPKREQEFKQEETLLKDIEETLRFYTQASKSLSSSLDYQTTLESVAKLAVPRIADWCAVDMINKVGKLESVALVHKTPKKVKWAAKIRKKFFEDTEDPSATYGASNVLKTGLPEYYPVIDSNLIESLTSNPKRQEYLKKLQLTSAIIVPIKCEGKIIGSVTFALSDSKKHYSEMEFKLVEQLGVLVSLAIENSILYKSVEEKNKRMTGLLEKVPAVLWEGCGGPSDPEQWMGFVSKYAEELFGYPVEEWTKKPAFALKVMHPDDRKKVIKEMSEIYEKGEGGVSRFRCVTKSGDIVWVENHLYIIKDDKGKPVGMRGVTTDITDFMEMEKRKDQFIGIASHELKTPLTSLKAFTQISQLTLKQKNGENISRYLSRMSEQIGKLELLINELLNVSKIQEGRLGLHKTKFSLSRLVNEAAEDVRFMIEPRPVVIFGDLKTKVWADRYRMGQVLSNLLLNAGTYSESDREIQVTIKNEKKEVIVCVRDYGVGIEKKHLDRIFGRFYRVGELQDNRSPGLGMGLFISKSIVEKHGGRIWVESQKGKGSSFYFSLPKGRVS